MDPDVDIPLPPVLLRYPSERRIRSSFPILNSKTPNGDTLASDALEITRRYFNNSIRTVCVCRSGSNSGEVSDPSDVEVFNVIVSRGPSVQYVACRNSNWRRKESSSIHHLENKSTGNTMTVKWPPSNFICDFGSHIYMCLRRTISDRMCKSIINFSALEGVRFAEPNSEGYRIPLVVRGSFWDYVKDVHRVIVHDNSEWKQS